MRTRLGPFSTHGLMTATLGQVIDALRNELQQYGEMLALLEAQQESFAQHEPGPLLNSISALETQSAAIEAARRIRETHQRQLAWSLHQSPNQGAVFVRK